MTESLRIYKALKHDVVTCTLLPGRSLSEHEMCDRYSGSRTPVREACRKLCEESLMQMIPFRGYSVPPLTIEEYRNLHELQISVEPDTAAFAAERANETQVNEIESWAGYEYVRNDLESYYVFLESNRNFHICIAAATRNQAFTDIVRNLQTRLMRYYYHVISMDSYGQELAAEHRELVQAIRSRDAKKARQSALDHLLNTGRRSRDIDLRSVNAQKEGLLVSAEPQWLTRPSLRQTPAGLSAHAPIKKRRRRAVLR